MIDYFKGIVSYLVVVFLVVVSYTELSHYWSVIGGARVGLIKFEMPFVLTLMLMFYFPNVKIRLIRYLAPIIPVLVLYLSFDVFYDFLGRSPRPSDFRNINVVSDFSLGMALFICLLIFLLLIPLVVLIYKECREQGLKSILFSLTYRMLALCAVGLLLLSGAFAQSYTGLYNYTEWSQEKSIKENGRFFSFIFFGYQERENAKILSAYTDEKVDIKDRLFPDIIKSPRNVHIVILESFIDPRQLDGVHFNRSPLAGELNTYLVQGKNDFSHVVSPVYGGNTAQAEFEVLTGVRALAKIESADFNILRGNEVTSFVTSLEKSGYRSIATLATNSGYYNSTQAYKSLGFDNVLFLGESDIRTESQVKFGISDTALLEYNLKRIADALKHGNKPLVSYALGMYGHFPYERDRDQEPDIITLAHQDARVERVANQFFYRTKAVADYIEQLMLIDPDSIIYITSDHIPPLLGDTISYKLDKYMNIALLIEDEHAVDVSGKKYFEIPWLIWDEITGVEHKRSLTDEEMKSLYFKLLSESISPE